MKTTLHQLSIFLENKIGSLYEIMDILSNANIRIIAATVADTTEFGILRLITNDNDKAHELLVGANKNVSRSEVIALSCDSLAGSFYNELKKFSAEGVVIEYMYCFSIDKRSFLIMRVNDIAKTMDLVERESINTISNAELATL
ncbi:MAG: acetolactate synthase [Rikenellaceae bacterium]